MTLFKQLYIGTLATITLTALLVLLAFNYYLGQDDINDFLRDIEKATADYQAEIIAPGNQLLRMELAKAPDCEVFCVSWLNEQGLTDVLNETIKSLRNEATLSVYRYKHHSTLAAIYAHPDLKGYLLITDLPDRAGHHEHKEITKEAPDPDYLFPLVFGILTALGIASVLFFLSSRIEHAIRKLQTVVSAYDSRPEHRADETSPEPVRQLALSFNQLAGRLDKQHQEQQIMMHAIAHELRTPLTRMQLALGMIDVDEVKPDTQALLANLDQYVTDMDQLTKDVLLLGHINQAPAEHVHEPIDFSAMLEQRLSCLPQAHHDKLSLRIDPDIHICISPNHLRLLIDNLLNNALVYAHSQVNVELAKQQNGNGNGNYDHSTITFRIADDGPGIDEAQKEQLFVPFYRGDESRDRKTGGFGLGLAIVDSIVRHYDGEIRVSNQDQGGAAFLLHFETPIHF